MVAAAVALVATGGVVVAVRAEASRLVNQADARHTGGDCQDSAAALEELGPLHRLVAGDVVDSSVQGRRACEVLLDATSTDGDLELDGLDDYLAHRGARWAHAGVVRADLLFTSSASSGNGSWDAPGRDPEGAVEQLAETLAAYPEESASVRDAMSTYVGRFKKEWYIEPTVYPGPAGYIEPVDEESLASEACAARDEYLWLHDGGWTEPELAEPIASTDDRGDDLLAGCAQARQAAGKLAAARSLYGEYLETYADAPGAKSVRKVHDELVESIRHQRMRDRAMANADHPADGSNLDACADARCQVRVTSGTLVPIGGPGGPYELLVWVHDKSVTAQLGGYIRSFSSNGGSISSGDGYATWSGGPGGELVLNDKVGTGVDGVRGDRATLSVWRAD
ncbi:hypothetical protein APR04_001420 [Promicromonospora umidemergens]|nr:hypothetical protein [Promicromonospora umidemergens]